MKVTFVTNYPVLELNGSYFSVTPIDRGVKRHFPAELNLTLVGKRTSGGTCEALHRLEADEVVLYTFDSGSFLGILKSLWCLTKLLYTQLRSTDLLLCKLFQFPSLAACLISKCLGKPYQTILVGDAARSLYLRKDLIQSERLRRAASSILKKVIDHCLVSSSVSVFVSKQLQSRYKSGAISIVASENWVTTAVLERYRSEVKSKFDQFPTQFSAERPLRVIFVGRLVVEKGLAVLAAALEGLDVPTKSRVKVRLVGAGKDEESLKEAFQNSGVNTEFVGYVAALDDKLWRHYIWADVVVLPSFSEGLPLCLLEAASFGCMIIASKVGGVPEVIEHLRNGMMLDDVSVESISGTLRTALDTPPLIRSLAFEAYSRAEEMCFESEQSRTFSAWQ